MVSSGCVVEIDVGAAAAAHLCRFEEMQVTRACACGGSVGTVRMLLDPPPVMLVELGGRVGNGGSSTASLCTIAELQSLALGHLNPSANNSSNRELVMRPDLQASMTLSFGQSMYRLAFITFCNDPHHWGIFHRAGGQYAGWHHYDDCANGGHTLMIGQDLIVYENGGLISTMGYIKI